MNLSHRKIKVGVVGPSWPFRGGIAKFTTELAEKLSEKGHLSTLISPRRQYPRIFFPGKIDRDEKSCKKLSLRRSVYSYYEPWTWREVIREIKSSDADCIVAPHWTAASAPFLAYLIRRSPKPVIPIVHNFSDHDSLIGSRRFSEWTLKGGVGFLHHNPEFSKLRFFKKRHREVVCQMHPVSKVRSLQTHFAKKKLGVPEGVVTFLFYGLIRPYKGLDVLFKAIHLLPKELKVGFLIAGEPWAKQDYIKAEIKKLSKKFWIGHQLTWISEKDTPLWFSAADAVVLPYIKATGSGVAAQAFAFQKPILTTQTGSLERLVKDGVNGLISKPGSPEELAEKIEKFLDPKLRAELTAGMINSPKESWEKYVESLVSLAERSVWNRGISEKHLH